MLHKQRPALVMAVALGAFALGCSSVMPELAEWKGHSVEEFIEAFSIQVGPSYKMDPVAAHINRPEGRVVYGMYLPAKGPDGKIHPTPKATTWPRDVAVEVEVKNGLIVAIRPATLLHKPSGPPVFSLN